MENIHIGSSFDDFLDEVDIKKSVEAEALKKISALGLNTVCKPAIDLQNTFSAPRAQHLVFA